MIDYNFVPPPPGTPIEEKVYIREKFAYIPKRCLDGEIIWLVKYYRVYHSDIYNVTGTRIPYFTEEYNLSKCGLAVRKLRGTL